MEVMSSRVTGSPARSDRVMASAPTVSTPQIRMSGSSALERGRDAGDHAAATDGGDDVGDLGLVLVQLQRQRALAGDHRRVVERMDHHFAGLDLVDGLGEHVGDRLDDDHLRPRRPGPGAPSPRRVVDGISTVASMPSSRAA